MTTAHPESQNREAPELVVRIAIGSHLAFIGQLHAAEGRFERERGPEGKVEVVSHDEEGGDAAQAIEPGCFARRVERSRRPAEKVLERESIFEVDGPGAGALFA